MNEWVKDFNVIYNEELYKNCVFVICGWSAIDSKHFLDTVEIGYINENGELKIIKDKVECFKFVRK